MDAVIIRVGGSLFQWFTILTEKATPRWSRRKRLWKSFRRWPRRLSKEGRVKINNFVSESEHIRAIFIVLLVNSTFWADGSNHVVKWFWSSETWCWIFTKVPTRCQKCGLLTFNSQLLNFYRTDSNAILDTVFINLFHIIIIKSNSHLNGKTRRKNLFKKCGISTLCVDIAFPIIRTKCRQGKDVLKVGISHFKM